MQLQCNPDIPLSHSAEEPPMQNNTNYWHNFNNYIHPNTLHRQQLGRTLLYYNLILGTVSRQARVPHVRKQRKTNQLIFYFMKCPKLLTAGLAGFVQMFKNAIYNHHLCILRKKKNMHPFRFKTLLFSCKNITPLSVQKKK